MKHFFSIATLLFSFLFASVTFAAEDRAAHCQRPKCIGIDVFQCKAGIRVCAAGVNMIIRDGKALCLRDGSDPSTPCPNLDPVKKVDSGEEVAPEDGNVG